MPHVVAAALVVDGRVLAARRTHPGDVAGRWELPGGKVDPGETVPRALEREIREELGCGIAVVRRLKGRSVIKPEYELTAYVVELVSGQPVPVEHDAIRWLGPEDLGDVDWLPSDRPFLPELRAVLLDGTRLAGGNVAGAIRIGATVRRTTGSWTPAVHDLLGWLHAHGFSSVPALLGVDELGREVLTYLPGRVLDNSVERATEPLMRDAGGWLRRYHDAVAAYPDPGGWRLPPEPGPLVCHHDFAPYNTALSESASGERVAGVFDWDLAASGTRLDDLAFAAWNWVPLWDRRLPTAEAAVRLSWLAEGYGDLAGHAAADIARAVVPRIESSIERIRRGQRDGDEGMLNLLNVGQPTGSVVSLAALRERIPRILTHLDRLP
jgi:8-oxo-dGTP diphosphatase